MWFTEEKWTIKTWEVITDYVLEYVNAIVPEGQDFMKMMEVSPKGLTVEQKGIFNTLVKHGYFKKNWRPFTGGLYYRTTKPWPKPKATFAFKKD